MNSKLSQLKNDGLITEQDYQQARSRGTRPGLLYGLPKIHKPPDINGFITLRPILSSVHTFNHNVGKRLATKLNHLRPRSNLVKDTFAFVDWLHHLKINPSEYSMLSFDITSFFTKVPLTKTIKITIDKLYGHEHTCTPSTTTGKQKVAVSATAVPTWKRC